MPHDLIFLINIVCSVFMTGLIWYVQTVHYPSFRFIEETRFQEFHNLHSSKTGFIVMPVMICELVTSGILSWFNGWVSLHTMGFYLVLAIWLSTFLLSVPAHAKLNNSKNAEVIDRLVSTNWIRTILWSLKSGLGLFMLL